MQGVLSECTKMCNPLEDLSGNTQFTFAHNFQNSVGVMRAWTDTSSFPPSSFRLHLSKWLLHLFSNYPKPYFQNEKRQSINNFLKIVPGFHC